MSGHKGELRGVPVLGGGKPVISEGGKKGFLFEPRAEDAALLRWQAGAFHDAEALLANDWRQTTHAIDLKAMQRELRKEYSTRLKLTTFDEVATFVDDLMASAEPAILLIWFLKDTQICSEELRKKIGEIALGSRFSLEASLPFTANCIRIALIFHFSLAFGLVSTRPTNRIDLEYFFYTPFCWAFSSGDSLHRDLAPHVFSQGQSFISREAFKADLKQLSQWWAALDEAERKKEMNLPCPPENDASVTHCLWKKHMRPDYRNCLRLEGNLPSEAAKRVMEYVRKLMKTGVPTEESPIHGSLDDCDFVAIPQEVRLDGPSICGSDLLFRDCCGRNINTKP